MLDKLKASKKLYLLIIVMTTSIIGIGLYGILELNKMHKRTQTLYADRVFPLQKLTRIQYNYSVGVLTTAQRVASEDITYQEGIELINKAEKGIIADWKSYTATYLTTREKKLASVSTTLINRLTKTIQQLKQVLKNDDNISKNTFVDDELYPQINAISTSLNRLITMQVKVGEEVYTSSNDAYDTALLEFLLLIFLSLVLATAFSYYVINNVHELISNLKQSKEKYQSLLSHAGDPVFLLNKAGYFIEVNNSMCQLLGYTEKEFLNMHLSQLFTAEELEKQPLQLKQLERERTLLLEKKWLKKNGTRVAVEINTRVFEGIGYLAIARNITDRIKVEQALRESERRYRNIFENVQDVFYQTNIDGMLCEVSPSILSHLGYSREELIGSNITSIYYWPGDRAKAIELLKKKGEFNDYEVSFRSKAGDEVFVSLNARLIYGADGLPSHLDGSFRNITEHQLAEEKLKKSEEKHRALIENISDTIILINDKVEVIYQSPSFGRSAGFKPTELEGKTILDFMHPGDLQTSKADLQKAKNAPGIPQAVQYRIIHKQGHNIWIEGTITNLLHNDSVNAYIVIYRDITERKAAEQERASMTSDIIQRNKDLEQFAYIISHNLRAPVANVIGITDLLHLPGLSNAEKEEMMEALSLNVNKLDSVIKDLNHILQVKREVSEKKGVVQLSKLLKDVENSILNMITQENVSIKSDFSAIDHFTTLKSYLYSVFFNLISNSIKYKRQDVNPEIEIISQLSGNTITLIFRDNGLGIDLLKYEDQIFGLYKRFHLHTEGKGIGLFMVKTQVETLGGKISIKSEPDRGSEFIIEFEIEESSNSTVNQLNPTINRPHK